MPRRERCGRWSVSPSRDRRPARDELASPARTARCRGAARARLRIVPLPTTRNCSPPPAIARRRARHGGRDHRHRVPRLDRGGRGLGARRGAARRLPGDRLFARGPKVAARCGRPGSPSPGRRVGVDGRGARGCWRRPGGPRVAVQLHGEPLPGFSRGAAGGRRRVVEVPSTAGSRRRISGPSTGCSTRCTRGVDAVTFTSAPAAACCGPGRAGRPAGRTPRRLPPRRAGRLRRAGLRAAAPVAGRADRHPDGSGWGAGAPLSRELPGAVRQVQAAGHRLEVRGTPRRRRGAAARAAGRQALLRALARRSGWVLCRGGAAAGAARGRPGRARRGDGDGAAADGPRRAELVETVVKRGYRLALDPRADDKYGSPH